MSSNLKVASLTLFVAFMLTIMPLPEWAIEFRPDWVTLVLVYWAMALPARVGVTIAWFAGLMLDVSHGAILGQHALGLMLVIYIVHIQHQRLRVVSLVQQAIVIFFLLLLKQGMRKIERLIHPHAQIPIRVGSKIISPRVIEAVWGFFALYVASFTVMYLALAATGLDLMTSFSAVTSSEPNISRRSSGLFRRRFLL